MVELRDISAQPPRYRLDKTFYDEVRAAKPGYRLVERFVIPGFSGRGFTLKAGQTFRVIQEEGPQVGDVVLYNAQDPRESFRSVPTWALEGWFLKRDTRLWSDLPWLRPMATCVEETLDFKRPNCEYHHQVVASQCSPEAVEMRWGQVGINVCRLNLLQAIEPFGLTDQDIFDNLDVFQNWVLDTRSGRFANAPNDWGAGEYIEFYAEMDLIVGISVCPTGDNTRNWAIYGEDVVLPLGIEVYDTGIEPKGFPAWSAAG